MAHCGDAAAHYGYSVTHCGDAVAHYGYIVAHCRDVVGHWEDALAQWGEAVAHIVEFCFSLERCDCSFGDFISHHRYVMLIVEM